MRRFQPLSNFRFFLNPFTPKDSRQLFLLFKTFDNTKLREFITSKLLVQIGWCSRIKCLFILNTTFFLCQNSPNKRQYIANDTKKRHFHGYYFGFLVCLNGSFIQNIHFSRQNVHFASERLHFTTQRLHFARQNVRFTKRKHHFSRRNVRFKGRKHHFSGRNVRFVSRSVRFVWRSV